MRAYQTIKFSEFPDVADIRNEARRSSVGGKQQHGYIRNKVKKARIRRTMKRSDKARVRAIDCNDDLLLLFHRS